MCRMASCSPHVADQGTSCFRSLHELGGQETRVQRLNTCFARWRTRFVMSLGMLPDDLVPLLAAQKLGPEWVTMIWGREWRNPSPFTRQRALPCHGVAEEFARARSASHRPGDQFGWHRRASRNGEVADFWLGCRGQRPIRID